MARGVGSFIAVETQCRSHISTEIIVPDNNPQIPVAAHGEEALDRLAPQIKALEPEQPIAANIDPDTAASRALGAVLAITALRARIMKECPSIDIHEIDDVENRAYALPESRVTPAA